MSGYDDETIMVTPNEDDDKIKIQNDDDDTIKMTPCEDDEPSSYLHLVKGQELVAQLPFRA